jgi:hypothetical protein
MKKKIRAKKKKKNAKKYLGKVAHACNSTTQVVVKAGELKIQGRPRLHRELCQKNLNT